MWCNWRVLRKAQEALSLTSAKIGSGLSWRFSLTVGLLGAFFELSKMLSLCRTKIKILNSVLSQFVNFLCFFGSFDKFLSWEKLPWLKTRLLFFTVATVAYIGVFLIDLKRLKAFLYVLQKWLVPFVFPVLTVFFAALQFAQKIKIWGSEELILGSWERLGSTKWFVGGQIWRKFLC